MFRRVPSRTPLISGPFFAPIAGLLALFAVLALVAPVAAAPTLGGWGAPRWPRTHPTLRSPAEPERFADVLSR